METDLILVPASNGFHHNRAAVALLRECYHVLKFGLAPFGVGLIYLTANPVSVEDQKVLGVIPWH